MSSEYFTARSGWGGYLSELQALAAEHPTVALQDLRGRVEHTQFRDAYYKRFPEMKRVREGLAGEEEVFYVRMVKERFGYDLVGFYEQNSTLCEAICEGLEAKWPYDTLAVGYQRVAAAEAAGYLAAGSALSLQACAASGLGIEGIGMYYWDRLNPLLEQAYTLMDTQTLNAPFLTR